MMWTERLADNGLSVVPVDKKHVRIGRGAWSEVYKIVEPSRRIHPRDVAALVEDASPNTWELTLLVAPVLSDNAAEVARRAGWSLVTNSGTGWIRTVDGTVELARADDADTPPGSISPLGYATFNVVRALLETKADHPLTQIDLSRTARVSQPRVSQILRRLADQQLVARKPRGWAVLDRSATVRWWTKNYPGPGGMRTHWFGLDTAVEQSEASYALLLAAGGQPLVSGDVAADIVAPWRSPRTALLYARKGADFTSIGLTAVGPGEATLTVVLPKDEGMWPVPDPRSPAHAAAGRPEIASPMQVLYDLRHGLGPDAAEAADHWQRRILEAGGGE